MPTSSTTATPAMMNPSSFERPPLEDVVVVPEDAGVVVFWSADAAPALLRLKLGWVVVPVEPVANAAGAASPAAQPQASNDVTNQSANVRRMGSLTTVTENRPEH